MNARAIRVEIDELRVDAEALQGNADDLPARVSRALERQIADRGLPTRTGNPNPATPALRDDDALAEYVADAVWQRLVVP